MAQFRSLLLPLALVFAAIAVFEFGARYGGTNMRAIAIAEQTQLSMEIFSQAHTMMSEEAKASYLMLIDRNIAAGALHRNIWHLSGDAQEPLDRALAKALSIRRNDVEKRFAEMEKKEDISPTERQNLTKIQEALRVAKQELVDSKTAEAAEE
jgi:hypothetical protein